MPKEGSMGPHQRFLHNSQLWRQSSWVVYYAIVSLMDALLLTQSKNQIDPVVFSLISIKKKEEKNIWGCRGKFAPKIPQEWKKIIFHVHGGTSPNPLGINGWGIPSSLTTVVWNDYLLFFDKNVIFYFAKRWKPSANNQICWIINVSTYSKTLSHFCSKFINFKAI